MTFFMPFLIKIKIIYKLVQKDVIASFIKLNIYIDVNRSSLVQYMYLFCTDRTSKCAEVCSVYHRCPTSTMCGTYLITSFSYKS